MIRAVRNIITPTLTIGDDRNEVFNFVWSRRVLFGITPLWIIYYFLEFLNRSDWPASIYYSQHWFGNLLAASRPSIVLFSIVSALGILSALFYYYRSTLIQRLICLLVLLWINSVNWTIGHSSHVAHVLIYLHLFTLFIPQDVSNKHVGAIRWSYFGVLVTYTFAGIWKVIGLGYKWFITGESMHWFHPEAAMRNAVSGHIDSGVAFDRVAFLFDYPLVWQCLFPIMMALQLFNFVGAFNPKLRPLIIIGNVSFHVVNSVVFLIVFWFTPLLLFLAFFPFHLFKSKK